VEEALAIVAALESARTQSGATLVELVERSPVLLVFLRHAGCPFCREALSDLARVRDEVESRGVRIVVAHFGREPVITALMERYGLANLDRISQPQRELYRAFGLKRGTAGQVLGAGVWWRGVRAALVAGHGLGRPEGDPFQMPGAFVLHRGGVAAAFRHHSSADRPDYLALVAKSIHHS
jgi:peroxiredoxin